MKGDKELIIRKCEDLGFKLVDYDYDYDSNRDNKFEVECLNCGKLSTKSFVTLVKLSHGCKYCHDRNRDYHNSLSEVLPKIKESCEKNSLLFLGFKNDSWEGCRKTKLIVKCEKCGRVFYKNYDNLVNKNTGCVCYRSIMATEHNKLNEDEVLKRIENVCKKNNFTFVKFLESDEKYHNNRTYGEFMCNECNNILVYNMNKFFNKKNLACKFCNKSSLEQKLKVKLINEGINFTEQQKYDWLVYKGKMSLDFYLPDYNIAVECQGIQHYEPVEYFGGEKAFEEQKKRDEIKYKLCEKNGIKLKYVKSDNEIENILK